MELPIIYNELFIEMAGPQEQSFKALVDQASSILEYGAGGSTVYALDLGKKIFTVETDQQYIDRLKEHPRAADLLSTFYVDVGPILRWGYAQQLDVSKNWYEIYAKAPWDLSDEYDLVVIDGRFRVLSFIASWTHAKEGTIIFWDDFKERTYYHPILDYGFPAPDYYEEIAGVWIKKEGYTPDLSIIDKFVIDQE